MGIKFQKVKLDWDKFRDTMDTNNQEAIKDFLKSLNLALLFDSFGGENMDKEKSELFSKLYFLSFNDFVQKLREENYYGIIKEQCLISDNQ